MAFHFRLRETIINQENETTKKRSNIDVKGAKLFCGYWKGNERGLLGMEFNGL